MVAVVEVAKVAGAELDLEAGFDEGGEEVRNLGMYLLPSLLALRDRRVDELLVGFQAMRGNDRILHCKYGTSRLAGKSAHV